MKAVRCNAWCQPADLSIEELPRPEPGPGQVLVRVHTAALNFPDVLMIQGLYQVKPPLNRLDGFRSGPRGLKSLGPRMIGCH